MKEYFQHMNFIRWFTLTMLVLSAVAGFFANGSHARLAEVQEELAETPGVIREIQELSLQITELQGLESSEALKGEGDPEFYIRGIATDNRCRIGQVDITPKVEARSREVEDRVYTIKPMDSKSEYTRHQIGNFLFLLESESRLVRVTRIKIDPSDRVKPGEIGPDRWSFEAALTSRQAAE